MEWKRMKPEKIIYINSDPQLGYKLDGLSESIDKNVLLEEVIEKYPRDKMHALILENYQRLLEKS
jgi:hypothetical protein